MKSLEDFEQDHYSIFRNQDEDAFDTIKSRVFEFIADKVGINPDQIHKLHEFVEPSQINALRMSAFQHLNELANWEDLYFRIGGKTLRSLLGPDVSIQIKLNLSIQMPNDNSSVLSLHTDTLSGQSPFEVVLWTALTNTNSTNAMYMFGKAESERLYELLPKYQHIGMPQLLNDHMNDAKFLDVEAGTCVLFSSTLFHGNVLNETTNTRISLNCRFKSLFSPEYATIPHERVTGTFYKPLMVSPLTKIGVNYNDDIRF